MYPYEFSEIPYPSEPYDIEEKIIWLFNSNSDVEKQTKQYLIKIQKPENDIFIALPEGVKSGKVPLYLIINNLIYSLRRFQSINDSRTHAIIYSYNIETKILQRHIYYSSNSDGGFWRLCFVHKDNEEMYDKGYSYTNTTMINMHIQCWLFKLQKLFEVKGKVGRSKDCGIIENSEISGRLLNKTSYGIFNIISHYFDFDTFTVSNDNYNEKILKLSTDINDLMNNLKYGNADVKYLLQLRQELFASVILYRAQYYEDDISRGELYKKLYSALLYYVRRHTNLIEGTKIVDINPKEITLEGKTFYAVICYKKIQDKKNGNIYIVYFMSLKSIHEDKSYTIILNIIPENNRLLDCGLDEKYIASGILIHKFADYNEQVEITKKKGEIYTFIYDIIDASKWLKN